MNNQSALRRRMSGSQIIGLLLMLAGFSIIFATGISASKHREHIFSAEESEYMEQAETDEEKDLLEKWTYTKDQTRKAAALPLLILSGFLIVAGAPLFYTPIAVEAHKSRMSRKEDAEKRRNLNRSARTSRKLDRELKKAQEEAERQAEQFRLEEKKKWERAHMTLVRDNVDGGTETPLQEVYFNSTPEPAAEPVTGSEEAEAMIRKAISKRSGRRRRNAAPESEPAAPVLAKYIPPEPVTHEAPDTVEPAPAAPEAAKPAPADTVEETAKPDGAASEKLRKDMIPDIGQTGTNVAKRSRTIVRTVTERYTTNTEKHKNAKEARAYFEKYDGTKSPKAPELEKKDLAYLNIMTAAGAEVEKHCEELRKKQAENWSGSGLMPEPPAQPEKAAPEAAAEKKAPAQTNKPRPAGSKSRNGSKGKKKNSRKKGGKRRKNLLF